MSGNSPRTGPRPFRVLVTSAGFEPGFRGGGPIKAVVGIVDSARNNTEVVLVTRDRDLGCATPYPGLSGKWISRGRTSVYYLDTRNPRQWLDLWRKLKGTQFDLLYVNSFWNPLFSMIPVLAIRLGWIHAARILLAPRGELAPGALSLKMRKKRLVRGYWSPFLRTMGVVWHASSDMEAEQIRATNPSARILVRQDTVSLPVDPIPVGPANDGPTRLVFIGRISPVKNLELILAALRTVSVPVAFDIYGPVEDSRYWSMCQALIAQAPDWVRVRYWGELAPQEVRSTFSQYDAFVLPTLGENFGYAIVESLSASCPVVCSDRTSWTALLEGGGGRVMRDLSVDCLGSELERLAGLTQAERLRAKQRAGAAYRTWREVDQGPDILEQARMSDWS